VTPFGSFYHPPTFFSTFKHCYPQSNEILLNLGTMLELKIKCTSFENIYNCNTYNNNNDYFKAIKKEKQGEIQIWPNLVLI
jgi:hypothetical protein